MESKFFMSFLNAVNNVVKTLKNILERIAKKCGKKLLMQFFFSCYIRTENVGIPPQQITIKLILTIFLSKLDVFWNQKHKEYLQLGCSSFFNYMGTEDEGLRLVSKPCSVSM